MKKHKDCPICEEKLFSDLGQGCKMCGMPLENKNEEFCSNKCRFKYFLINKIDNKIIAGIFSIILLSNLASAQLSNDTYNNCWNMMGYGYGMWIFGWLFGVLVIITLILFIVWLIKQIQKDDRKRK